RLPPPPPRHQRVFDGPRVGGVALAAVDAVQLVGVEPDNLRDLAVAVLAVSPFRERKALVMWTFALQGLWRVDHYAEFPPQAHADVWEFQAGATVEVLTIARDADSSIT